MSNRNTECLIESGQINTCFYVYVLCLVCRKTVAFPKEYILRRHFESKHPDISKFDAHKRKI
jgi:hypothetical protein